MYRYNYLTGLVILLRHVLSKKSHMWLFWCSKKTQKCSMRLMSIDFASQSKCRSIVFHHTHWTSHAQIWSYAPCRFHPVHGSLYIVFCLDMKQKGNLWIWHTSFMLSYIHPGMQPMDWHPQTATAEPSARSLNDSCLSCLKCKLLWIKVAKWIKIIYNITINLNGVFPVCS